MNFAADTGSSGCACLGHVAPVPAAPTVANALDTALVRLVGARGVVVLPLVGIGLLVGLLLIGLLLITAGCGPPS